MISLIIATLLLPSTAFSPTLLLHVPSTTKSFSVSRLPAADFKLHVASTRSNDRYKRNEVSTEDDSKGKKPQVNLSESYQQLQKDYYLQMAFLQAGVLASSADITTQTMETASIDFGHVAAMATVASTMSGVTNAIWLGQLEAAFPGTEKKEVFCKTMIHATIIATIINSAYLVFVPIFTTYLFHNGGAVDLSIIVDAWTPEEFFTLMKLEVLMFIPYNTLAFKYIPPSVRPLTHALVSATFNVAVSAVTLGFFDKWCENAMHLIS